MGRASSWPAGKDKFIHCLDTIGERNAMISQDFYGIENDLSEGQMSPCLWKNWLVQVECIYTLPMGRPINLSALHLLYNNCELTTVQTF